MADPVRSIRFALAAAVLIIALPCMIGARSPSEGPAAPGEPAEPSVDIGKSGQRIAAQQLRVAVTTARGNTMTGILAVNAVIIEADSAEDGAVKRITISLNAVSSIEFIRWRGTIRRKDEYAFYPVRAVFTMTDNARHETTGNIPLLNRLLFREGNVSRYLYAYFFDYRENNAWRNSGESDLKYPETNPAGDAVVKIEFIREDLRSPLEKLFLGE